MTKDSVTEVINLSWSQLTRYRTECAQRFGGVRHLPLRAPHEELTDLLRSDNRVLDIGTGLHKMLPPLRNLPAHRYFSLDNDPAGDYDFWSFDEVPADLKFDLMLANQFLEHLTVVDAFEMLRSAYRHLVDGGYLLATVPNAAHPVRQWQDATHLTAWAMGDLYGLFRAAGFHVSKLARYNKHPLTRNPIKRLVVNIVCEAFRMDWCDSLMIVGQKVSKDA